MFTFPTLVTTCVLLPLSCLILQALLSPLRSIPGPFLARFTKLWHFYHFRKGNFERKSIDLHSHYNSKIVRYGPKQYSISDPAALRKIYSYSHGFDKSLRYSPWFLPRRTMLFTEPKEDFHRQMRRKYQDMYSVTSMLKYEPVVDHCVELFCARMEEFSARGETIDLARWLLCYAADTVSMITWSVRFGYLDKGEDVHGILETVHEIIAYAAKMGIFHEWHSRVFWVREMGRKIGLGKGVPRAALVRWVSERLVQRREQRGTKEKAGPSNDVDSGNQSDMLDQFLDANRQNPTSFDDARIYDGLTGNIVAGSDTTAIALCSIIYHLAKTPTALQKLRAEIDDANGRAAKSISFKQIQDIPYLQAVIQEALRIHPPVGSHLERVVPASGLEVAGHYLPPGNIVGANAWVVHRDTSVFGRDVDTFRPERWLEADLDELAEMKRNFMPFGLGSRLCLGKNMSMLEISKLIPELFRRFDFGLDDEQPWKTENVWFIFVTELKVRMTMRRG